MDETNSHVGQIRCNLRKRAREEVVPIPPIYNDALIELSTQHDHPLHLHYITLHLYLQNYLDYHVLDILGHGPKCLDIMGLDLVV